MPERPPIGHFSQTIKHAVCSEYRRCNTSDEIVVAFEHGNVQEIAYRNAGPARQFRLAIAMTFSGTGDSGDQNRCPR